MELPKRARNNVTELVFILDRSGSMSELESDTIGGHENASHKYTSEQVKKMIERQKEKYDWEFLFIGANIDAVETAARYGIDKERAVNYKADSEGTHVLYESVSNAVCKLRASAPIGDDWSEEIKADYQRRSKKK